MQPGKRPVKGYGSPLEYLHFPKGRRKKQFPWAVLAPLPCHHATRLGGMSQECKVGWSAGWHALRYSEGRAEPYDKVTRARDAQEHGSPATHCRRVGHALRSTSERATRSDLGAYS